MGKFEEAAKKALKMEITLTKTLDEWRKLGELLQNYKELISSLHGSFLNDVLDDASKEKKEDLQNKLANQGMAAMQFERELMRDLIKASGDQVHDTIKEALDEHEKAK